MNNPWDLVLVGWTTAAAKLGNGCMSWLGRKTRQDLSWSHLCGRQADSAGGERETEEKQRVTQSGKQGYACIGNVYFSITPPPQEMGDLGSSHMSEDKTRCGP